MRMKLAAQKPGVPSSLTRCGVTSGTTLIYILSDPRLDLFERGRVGGALSVVTHSLDLVVSLPCPGMERNYFGLRSRLPRSVGHGARRVLSQVLRDFPGTFLSLRGLLWLYWKRKSSLRIS